MFPLGSAHGCTSQMNERSPPCRSHSHWPPPAFEEPRTVPKWSLRGGRLDRLRAARLEPLEALP
eukprot:7201692-Prymnesium_polylepis.2